MAKVFISYRQLNDAQRQRVRDFADRVRGCGIEVVLDQFYKDAHPGGPPEGWPKWSSDQAVSTERVLIIGNAPWFRCFNGTEKPGTGLGAACEAGNIRQRLYDLGGHNDIIRVVYFEEMDITNISFDLKRYDRFHADDDFAHIIAWLGGTAPVDPDSSPAVGRGWVWTSSLESRAAGQKSVLACVETLVGVAAYWWIALRFNTHWHLVSSVVIAPLLLLLRSPESIAAGLRWFGKDWFGFENYETWPKGSKAFWMGAASVVSGVTIYCLPAR